VSKTFLVWINKNVPGVQRIEQEVTLEDDEDVDEALAEVVTTMIENEVTSGWAEVEACKPSKRHGPGNMDRSA